jgi:hypothetical protein
MRLSRRTQFGAAVLALLTAPAPLQADCWDAEGVAEVCRSMQTTQPTVELLLAPKVGLGDTVEIILRLHNDGSRPMDLQLPGRPVAFDIAILRPDGTEIWRRLAKGVVSSALMLVRLPPKGIRDFVVQWGQVDNAGRPVGQGTYVVRGTLPTEAGQLAARPRDLLIEPHH